MDIEAAIEDVVDKLTKFTSDIVCIADKYMIDRDELLQKTCEVFVVAVGMASFKYYEPKKAEVINIEDFKNRRGR